MDTFEDEDNKFLPGNSKSGYKGGIKWKRQALTGATNLGYNKNHKDQIHKVSIKVPKNFFKQGKLDITFDVNLMEKKNRVSAGVDEFRITAHPRRCRDTKRTGDKGKGKKKAKVKKAAKDKAKKAANAKKQGKVSKKTGKQAGNEVGEKVKKNPKKAGRALTAGGKKGNKKTIKNPKKNGSTSSYHLGGKKAGSTSNRRQRGGIGGGPQATSAIVSKKKKKTKKLKVTRRHRSQGTRALEEDDLEEEEAREELSLDTEDEGDSPVECRVAYAFHSSKVSTSFKEIGFKEGQIEYENEDISWGWSNGPLAASNYAYSFELYSRETVVGQVSVAYDEDGEAVVTMEAGERLWLKNVHAYVGHARLPISGDGEVVSPPAYPVVHDRMSLTRTFLVGGLDGSPIHIVAEATVCGVFPTEDGSAKGDQGSFFSKLF